MNKMIVSYFMLLILTCLGGTSHEAIAHEDDNWTDHSEYVVGNSHLKVTRHYSTRTEALNACIAYAANYNYSAGTCHDVGPGTWIEAGWLRHSPRSPNFDLVVFYFDFYTLEAPEAEVCKKSGNPCSLSTGVKTQIENDFTDNSINGLSFSRIYTSAGDQQGILGNKWQHNFSLSISQQDSYVKTYQAQKFSAKYRTKEDACLSGWLVLKSKAFNGALSNGTAKYSGGQCKVEVNGKSATYLNIRSDNPRYVNLKPTDSAVLSRPAGKKIVFEFDGFIWKNIFSPKLKLVKNIDSWVYTNDKGIEETYNFSGQLVEIRAPEGTSKTFEYDLSEVDGGDDNPNTLDRINNSFGKKLSVNYDENGRISRLVTPKGNIDYQYEETNNVLTRVIYEDLTTKEYVYENTNWPTHLTGIIDENGIRFATWQYDSNGRAILSKHAEEAESVAFEYLNEGITKTTDALGATRSYSFEFIEGKQKVKSVTGDRCMNCNHGHFQAQTFNEYGELATQTDWNGIVTSFEYTNHFITKKTFAVGTPEQKIITTTWDENLKKPLINIEGNLKAEYNYDAQGNVLSVTLTDLVSQEIRTSTMTYNTSGQLISIDGSREDVDDLSLFEYNAQGELSKFINALNQETQFTSYDSVGMPLTIIHSNNIAELRTYSLRGHLLTQTFNGAITTYGYDNIGQLTSITYPNSVTQQFEYDGARRLVATVDGVGNRNEYVFDIAGNVTQSKIIKVDGSVVYSEFREYDKLSQLIKTISGQNIENSFEYDSRGSLVKLTDGLLNNYTSTVDGLARLTEQLDPEDGKTQFNYDTQNNLTKVIDAEEKVTEYEYNAFGEVTKKISPDTGTSIYTYDKAGNLLSVRDARGITVTYTYDALNRVLTQSYPNSFENVIYSYDDGANENKGIGRLTHVNDESGSTDYIYNGFGQITRVTQNIGTLTFVTEYQYDTHGQLTSVVYPSGRQLNYNYDNLGNVNALTSTLNSETKVLANNLTYLPFGPLKSMTYGNGNIQSRLFDLDFRLVEKNDSLLNSLTFLYDLTNNVTNINRVSEVVNNESFSYDKLSRLLIGNGNYGEISYSYDKVGNRLTKNSDGDLDSYHYATESHMLTSVSGANILNQSFDLVGNTLTRNSLTFTYNNQGRLKTSSKMGMNANYTYNFKGERVTKLFEGNTIHFIFDIFGKLIAETNSQGNILKQYYYLNGQPLVMEYIAADSSEEMQLDNNDATFSTTWSESTSVSGYIGNNYLEHSVLTNEPIIYDSEAASTTIIGSWVSLNNSAGYIGNNFLGGKRGSGERKVIWNLNAMDSGEYNVYARWTIGSNRATNASYQINHKDGSNTVVVNQRTNGAQWVLLGTYNLNEASTVSIDNNANGDVVADAIQLVPVINTTNNYLEWPLNTIVSDTYQIYATWPSDPSHATNANFTVNHQQGSSNVSVDQTVNGGSWQLLGTFTLDYNSVVALSNVGNGIVVADGLRIVKVNSEITSGGFYFYHTDHLGTPTTLTDEAGIVQWKAHYTPFGKAIIEVNNIQQNIRYPGQYYDEESGLHYNYFRDYDPEIGRYIQSDPIGLNGGINTYGYALGNPIMNTDPLGLYSPEAHDALIRYAFKDCISASDYAWIQASSRVFDSMTQAPHLNAYHSLLRPGQSAQEMISDRSRFIGNLSSGIRTMGDRGPGGQNRIAALIVFGNLAHPMMDQYSPAHVLADGSPATWDPFNPFALPSTTSHSPFENIGKETVDDITPEVYEQVRRDLLNKYSELFGDCECTE